MSDGIKGWIELQELKKREKTWQPPDTLEEYLEFVKLVVETSKYQDAYQESTPEEIATVAKLKFRRLCKSPDVEECVDVGCYAYLAYDLIRRKESQTE